jgi:hypothetical protein
MFLVAIMSVFLLSVSTPTSPPLPKVGATCFNSGVYLGTSNLPPGNTKSSTVVNIAAFVNNDSKPFAWVYRSAAGDLWFQANASEADALRKALTPQWSRVVKVQPGHYRATLVKLSVHEGNTIEYVLINHGITFLRCFSERLRV